MLHVGQREVRAEAEETIYDSIMSIRKHTFYSSKTNDMECEESTLFLLLSNCSFEHLLRYELNVLLRGLLKYDMNKFDRYDWMYV